MDNVSKLITDLPEGSAPLSTVTAELNPETSIYKEESIPSLPKPKGRPRLSIPEAIHAVESITKDAGYTVIEETKIAEKGMRVAIRTGLYDGLRQMGKLPEWLVHELEKLTDYIHVEVSKI